MAGAGWSVNLATLTATRSNALAAGASYPALTLTVNVAASAPANVTNTATVSGGGEMNTSNDTASDPTFIGLPEVTGTSPSHPAAGLLPLGTSSLAVNFNVTVLGAGTAANYQLQSVGPDGLLGTADNVSVALGASPTAAPPRRSASRRWPENVYRLTVDDSITDTGGVKLDGNGSAAPGSDWTTDFVVVGGNASLLGAAGDLQLGREPLRWPWPWATSTATASPIWPWRTRRATPWRSC